MANIGLSITLFLAMPTLLVGKSQDRVFLRNVVAILDCISPPKVEKDVTQYGCTKIAVIHCLDEKPVCRVMEITLVKHEKCKAIIRSIEIPAKLDMKFDAVQLHKKMRDTVVMDDPEGLFNDSNIDLSVTLPAGIGSELDYWVAVESLSSGTVVIRAGTLIGSGKTLIPWLNEVEKKVFNGCHSPKLDTHQNP